MGSWDYGLYDNDRALDTLASVVRSALVLDADPGSLVGSVALVLWLQPSVMSVRGDEYGALLARPFTSLPTDAQAVLAKIASDPAAFVEGAGRSRSAEVRAVLGGYSDGARLDVLLRVPGAEVPVQRLAEGARAVLDEKAVSLEDLFDGDGPWAAVGILLELTEIGVVPDARDVARWREAFERADAATTDERDFFDRYAANLRAALALLEARAK